MFGRIRNWLRAEDFTPSEPGNRLRRRLWCWLNWASRWQLDSALRYRPICRDLRRRPGPMGKIAEIGSGDYGITSYYRKPVIGLDLAFIRRNLTLNGRLLPITGSASDLPLKSRYFDAVICVDVMEHLPAHARLQVLAEMVRIIRTGGKIYVIFPCGHASQQADQKLQDWYQRKGPGNPWLSEHIRHGLPERQDFERLVHQAAQARGRRIQMQVQGNVARKFWLAYQYVLGVNQTLLSLYAQRLLQPLLPLLSRINGQDSYRQLFVIQVLD